MKKWIFSVIGIVVIGFAWYQWKGANTSNQQVTAQIRTATVQKGILEVKVTGSGSVQPVTNEDIKSTIDNNEIDQVKVTAGESVSKGDELVTFTDGSEPITAPSAGVITTVSALAGQKVTTGQVIAHLTNYKDLQTVVQIDELDIPKVKAGQTVSLTASAYPDKTYSGTVIGVANEGTSSNGSSTFEVTIHINKPENLKVGMSTNASILTASKDNALYVPVTAVYTANNQKYVIASAVATGSETSNTLVKTGLENDEFIEITAGVSEGQTIELPQASSGTSTSSTSSTNAGGKMQGGMGAMGGGMPPGQFGA